MASDLVPFPSSYQLVMSALNVLKSQKVQAERDIAKLEAQKQAALANPPKFIASLMTKTNEPVPKRQKVVKIPVVPLEKYGLSSQQLGFELTPTPLSAPQTPSEHFKEAPYMSEAYKVRWTGCGFCLIWSDSLTSLFKRRFTLRGRRQVDPCGYPRASIPLTGSPPQPSGTASRQASPRAKTRRFPPPKVSAQILPSQCCHDTRQLPFWTQPR